MLFAEPQPTQWDLHFQLLGIPIRISPLFWLGNIVLGWGFAQKLFHDSHGSVSIGAALLIWTGVVLVSIIAHEMGHAMAFRLYGVHSHIVLYHFGGIAVPDGSFGFGRRPHVGSIEQIVISAAGPAASLALGFLFVAIIYFGGFAINNPLPFIKPLTILLSGERVPSIMMQGLLYAVIFVNIGWAMMNLLPVYPLDGGQISREAFLLSSPHNGIRNSLTLSIMVAGGMALWALSKEDTYLAFMFGWLAYSSFMILQAYSGRGGRFGGG